MSTIILSPKEFVTTTSATIFHGPTETIASSDTRFFSSELTKPVHPHIKRSPRTGLMPVNASQYSKELDDPVYRQRMEAARTELARDISELGIKSLSTLRLSRGFSQSQLAQMIGTSQPHIAKIESGNLNPHWQTVVKIADALNVSLDTLRPFIRIEERVESKPAKEAGV